MNTGTNFEAIDARYAISAIKLALLQQGIRLADERHEADTIIKIRSGALSIDHRHTVVGTPSTDLGAINSSEVSVYSVVEQEGVARFGALAYDAETGEFLVSADPVYGFARKTGRKAFSIFTWDSTDYQPGKVGSDWPPWSP